MVYLYVALLSCHHSGEHTCTCTNATRFIRDKHAVTRQSTLDF